MSNILSRKFWRNAAGLIALAIGLGASHADVFRDILRPGESVTHTVSVTTPIEPRSYGFTFVKPLPSGIEFTRLQVYLTKSSGGFFTSWTAWAEYKITAGNSVTPGDYEIIGRYSFYPGSVSIGAIASVTFTNLITIPGPCIYTLGATEATAEAVGGSGTITISGGTTCGWNATSSNAWVTIERGTNSVGSGLVSYTVAANPNGSARTATLTIAGQSFVIKQAGWQPRLSIERLADGSSRLNLLGRNGVRHQIESSADMNKWALFEDVTLEGSSRTWVLPAGGQGRTFFRARELSN